MTLKKTFGTMIAAATLATFTVGMGANAQPSTPSASSASPSQASTAQPAAPTELTIPDRAGVWGDIVYGSPDAPVELIEYASLTCPHCASFARDVLPLLMQDFVNDGKVRFVFRNFILNRLDLAAAAASRCLTGVDATKRAMETLFAEQNTWLRADNQLLAVMEIVGREGITEDGVRECLSDQQVTKHLVEMMQQGAKDHEVNSTPTLVLNGVSMSFPGYAALKLRIEAQLGSDYINK